ncbi:PREDICTED: transcriptional regulator of filamentous growth FLO8-like [Bactrocera latifrons]|uniref:transcriptional regulator of filamentous growth FLO8-like n=1 Tax=Bactrocera latifrons TaxID=174628 RepID=UPI0008DE5131|nr:PREDICTED: transcriptional regulator of filamentous growth FLO8-like [Bactrocera latifrons]
MQFIALKLKLNSQQFLLVTLLLITTTLNSDGYGHQQTATQQHNGYIYGPPPPPPFVNVPRALQTSAPTGVQVPVLTAVVRPLGPPGRNYEVRLSQPNHHNLLHRQPPPQATINGPSLYYTNNYQPVNSGSRYAPTALPSQTRPHQQAFRGAADQQYSNNAAGSAISNTPHQNPLLTPQNGQPAPPPASLTPVPTPQLSQSFSNQGNQQNNGNSQLTPQYAQPASPPSGFTPTPQQSQSFANAGNQPPLGTQQSNGAGTNGNAPNFAATTADNGLLGNYISQSEVGRLDYYLEKQNPVGDTRAYTRLINTCYSDGHCDQQQLLGAGETHQRQQQVVLNARARTQPISDKCRALGNSGAMPAITAGSVSVGNPALNSANRPPNRRLYQYTEVVIPQDPFN